MNSSDQYKAFIEKVLGNTSDLSDLIILEYDSIEIKEVKKQKVLSLIEFLKASIEL